MPARRPAPLYKRRNVGLRVCTSIASATDDVKDISEQRGRKRQRTSDTDRFGIPATTRTSKSPELKRKRVLPRKPSKSPYKRPAPPSPVSPVSSESEDKDEEDSLSDVEDADRTLVADDPSELRDYHEIVPGVFVVVASINFGDGFSKSFKFDDEFTHVVRVAPAKTRETWNDVEEEESIEILNMSFPIIASSSPVFEIKKADGRVHSPVSEKESAPLSLSSKQLQMARDFLSLALPYYSDTNPTSPEITKVHGSQPKALIIAPTHIDALSIVVTYLAFCSGEPAFTVIQYIDDEPEVPEAWRNIFPTVESEDSEDEKKCYGESAKRVEVAARLKV